MKRNDILIIVFGCGVDESGNLMVDSMSRVAKGVELYKKNRNSKTGSKIIMSGAHSFLTKKIPKTSEASAMKRYALRLGIPAKDIIIEDKSLDTIGNLYYSRIIIDKYGSKDMIKDIIIVTSSYHINRARMVARMIFDDSYKISFEGAYQKRSIFKIIKGIILESTFKTWYLFKFHDFPDGDMKKITPYLKEHHPAYKNI